MADRREREKTKIDERGEKYFHIPEWQIFSPLGFMQQETPDRKFGYLLVSPQCDVLRPFKIPTEFTRWMPNELGNNILHQYFSF